MDPYNNDPYRRGDYPPQQYQQGPPQGEAASYYAGGQSQPQHPPPQPGPYEGQPPAYAQNQGQAPSFYEPGDPRYPPPSQEGPPQGQYQPERDPSQSGGGDGERGVMGALAGGAAGAYGGHKLGGKYDHGVAGTIVGALAGAFAGHKTQEAVHDWREDRKEKKEEKRHDGYEAHEKHHHGEEHHHGGPPGGGGYYDQGRRDDREMPRGGPDFDGDMPRGGGGGGNYAGNFSSSARDIRLDAGGEYLLHAECRRMDGSYEHSTISLNSMLANDNGRFRWSSGGGGGGGSSTVTVQQGDTLRDIAGRFGCSFEDIARHNNIANPDMIYPGQVLQVPGGGGHGGGGGFGSSARDVRLVDGGRILEAELLRNGDWVRSSIVLDERIGNQNGSLHLA